MNIQQRLASTATTLAAGLLIVTGCGVTHARTAPQAQDHTSKPCRVSTDRIGDSGRPGRQPPGCLPDRHRSSATCLVVADRVQEWIDLRIGLPRCVRDLQQATLAAPGPVVGRR